MRFHIVTLLSVVIMAGMAFGVSPPNKTDPDPEPPRQEARRRPESRQHTHPPSLPLRRPVLDGKWMYFPEHGWVFVPRVQPFPPPLPKAPSIKDLKKYIE